MCRGWMILAVLALCFAPVFASAQTESSEHYQVQEAVLSGGDNPESSSESYSSQSSLGEPIVGPASSASNGSESGFDRTTGTDTGDSGRPSDDSTKQEPGTSQGGSINPGSVILGCSDPTALNFDPRASTNDGSCRYAASDLQQEQQGTGSALQGDDYPAAGSEDGSENSSQLAALEEIASPFLGGLFGEAPTSSDAVPEARGASGQGAHSGADVPRSTIADRLPTIVWILLLLLVLFLLLLFRRRRKDEEDDMHR